MFNKTPLIFRQGDVLLRRISKLPKRVKGEIVQTEDDQKMILAYGEVTGHSHQIVATRPNMAAMFTRKSMRLGRPSEERFLRVKKTVMLKHEEHGEITIPKGDYEVIRQREYDPVKERYVAD